MDNQLGNLTPEQQQQLMLRAQQEANMQITRQMVERMGDHCFTKCAGTYGDKLDSKEQNCLAQCQDRYLETRQAVQEALRNRQSSMM